MVRQACTTVITLVLAATALMAVAGPVGAETWLPPVALTPDDGYGTLPEAVVDGAGNVAAVWVDGSPADIAAVRLLVGGSWTPKQDVSSVRGVMPPMLVSDAAGNVTAAWSADDPATAVYDSAVYVARRTPAGAWSPATRLTGTAPTVRLEGLGIDAAGTVSLLHLSDRHRVTWCCADCRRAELGRRPR